MSGVLVSTEPGHEIDTATERQGGSIVAHTGQSPHRMGFKPTLARTGSVLEAVADNGSQPCIRAFVVGNMTCGVLNHFAWPHLLKARYIIQPGDRLIPERENVLRMTHAGQTVDVINLAPLAYSADHNFVNEVPECHISVDDNGTVQSTIHSTNVVHGQTILRMPVPAVAFEDFSFYKGLSNTNHPNRSRERVGLYAVGDMSALMSASMLWTDREYTQVLLNLLAMLKNTAVDNYSLPSPTSEIIRR